MLYCSERVWQALVNQPGGRVDTLRLWRSSVSVQMPLLVFGELKICPGVTADLESQTRCKHLDLPKFLFCNKWVFAHS